MPVAAGCAAARRRPLDEVCAGRSSSNPRDFKYDSKEYVIVLVDGFTKFIYLHHTRKIDSLNTIKALKSAIFLFGSLCRIVADQGRCFKRRVKNSKSSVKVIGLKFT